MTADYNTGAGQGNLVSKSQVASIMTERSERAVASTNALFLDGRSFEEEPLVLNTYIYIPSNSKHVERSIQLVASKATKSSNSTVRDGLCKATIDERKQRPNLDQKPE